MLSPTVLVMNPLQFFLSFKCFLGVFEKKAKTAKAAAPPKKPASATARKNAEKRSPGKRARAAATKAAHAQASDGSLASKRLKAAEARPSRR